MVYSAKSDDIGTISQFTRLKYIHITTNGSSTPVNYQVKLTIDYEPEMQADFSDIRFNTLGNIYIDYWIESKTDSVTATVWVELPDAITDPGSNTIWMHYGNADLSDGGNIGDTFIIGDDFADGDYTSNPTWTVRSGTWSASDYYLKKTSATAWEDISTPSTSNIAVWEYKYKAADNNAQQLFFISSTTNPSTTNGYFVYLTTIAPDRILLYRSNGGAHQQLASVNHAIDTEWHDIKITRDSSNEIKVYFDDVLKITHTDATYTTSSYIIQRVNNQNTDQIDDIRIRKYIANEPVPIYGTAQHQRRVPQFIN